MRGEAQACAAAEGVRETIGVALLMYAGSTPDGQRAPRRWGRPQLPHTRMCILTGKGGKARAHIDRLERPAKGLTLGCGTTPWAVLLVE